MGPLEKVLCGVPRECQSELSCQCTADLVQLNASSFGPSAIAYGLTRLFLYGRDNRQRLRICRILCLLEYSQFDSFTVSRMHVNVYKLPATVARQD
jgi:hypothetical protein